MKQGLRPWLGWLLKLAVAAGLLIFLFSKVEFADLRDALLEAKPLFIAAAFALAIVNIALQALRWFIFIRSEYSDIPFHRCLSSLLGGFSMGLITPGRVGEIGRVLLLKVPSRLRLAGLHVFDKMYLFGAIALSGPLLLFIFPGFRDVVPEPMRDEVGIFVLLLPLLYFWIALDPRLLKVLLLGIQLAFPGKPGVRKVVTAFEGLNPRDSARALLITLAQLLIIFTQFHFVSNAFQPVAWGVAAHTYGAVMFIKTALPISLGSLGVGEWASVSLYERYGIASTTALNSSLLVFGMNVLLPALVGLLVLFRERLVLFPSRNTRNRLNGGRRS